MSIFSRSKILFGALAGFLVMASISIIAFSFFNPKTAKALSLTTPVGGMFLPGLFDIYTPDLTCGLLVSVAGPNGGVFAFLPIDIYNYFPLSPFHAGDNTLGLASPPTVCPYPAYFMFGSSLGF
jgi:hypothetical protein